MDMHDAIVAAVTSVASHGDTDVLPFPFECHLFHDEPQKCVELLEAMHSDFEACMATSGPDMIQTLSQWSSTARHLQASRRAGCRESAVRASAPGRRERLVQRDLRLHRLTGDVL
jgi:hypothetical protein